MDGWGRFWEDLGLQNRHGVFRYACEHALEDISLTWRIGIFSGNPND